MRKIMWIATAVVLVGWSLFAFGAYAFVELFGDAAKGVGGYVPGFPIEPFSVPWFAEFGRTAGFAAVLVGWVMGVLAIVAIPAILTVLFGRRRGAPRGDASEGGLRLPGWGRRAGPYGLVPPHLERSERQERLVRGRSSR